MFKKLFSIKHLVLLIALSISQPLMAGLSGFVFTVDTQLGSGADTFTIPTNGTGYKYNVDCNNDGKFEAFGESGNYTCDFSSIGGSGIYDIRIEEAIGDGTGFPRFRANEYGEAVNIIELKHWGKGIWDSMESAFEGAVNLTVTATDFPELGNVTSMRKMFSGAASANPNTSKWDTTNITDMSFMFSNTSAANPDTSGWNTANVTDMSFMFSVASAANPNTSNWDTTNVTAMHYMFNFASVAIPNTSDWDTANVTDMQAMFRGTDLANPNTSDWDTANVTDMRLMFNLASAANPDTSGWDTTNVTNMSFMFYLAIVADPDTSGWDTTNVTDMNSMFRIAVLANPDTSGWDTTNVTDMSFMFRSAALANPNTSNWNTINVTDMQAMFRGSDIANPNTSNWDTTNVTDMSYMFSDATLASHNMSGWNIANVTTMTDMFFGVTLPTSSYDAMLINFSSQAIQYGVELDGGFSKYCANSAHDNLTNATTGAGWTITDGGLDPACSSPTDGFVIQVDTRNTGTSSTTEFEIRTIGTGYNYNVDCDDDNPQTNTAIAQTQRYTCNYASPGIYTIRIEDNTGNGNGFPRIQLNNVGDKGKIIDLIQWGTGHWASMEGAFFGASNMTVTATDAPNLSQVTSLKYMFIGASVANPDTSSWNTSNVTDMSFMFYGAELANPDTSGWNTANVTDMSYMFTYAYLANPDTNNWDITEVTTMQDIFDGVTLPTKSYDAMLVNFNSQIVLSGVEFDGGNSKYCDSTARDNLINSYMWDITDAGLDPLCDDIIYRNSFELPVTVFKAIDKLFSFDFALLDNIKLDSYPELIAIGLDVAQEKVVEIHIRKLGKALQIRMSQLSTDEFDENYWINQEWQNITNSKLTTVSW